MKLEHSCWQLSKMGTTLFEINVVDGIKKNPNHVQSFNPITVHLGIYLKEYFVKGNCYKLGCIHYIILNNKQKVLNKGDVKYSMVFNVY